MSKSDKSSSNPQKRQELADFLRTRREKIKPEEAGFCKVGRRRTPGLRREEVAELAGVGTAWYTWLEQAREIQPSAEVLSRLARALKLSPFEAQHLFTLSGRAYPGSDDRLEEKLSPSLERVLHDSVRNPAFVIGQRWDILAWNAMAELYFPDVMALPRDKLNWVYFALCSPLVRKSLVSWETHARRILGEFRASLGDSLGSSWVVELIELLKANSEEFHEWWKVHEIRERVSTSFEFQHPDFGTLAFERVVFLPSESPKTRVLIFNPLQSLPRRL